MYYYKIALLAILISVLQLPQTIGEEISVDKAIAIVKNLEKRFQGIQFTAIIPATPPISYERAVIYDFVQHRYFIADKSVTEWRDGSADNIACVTKFSYDGKLFYDWEQCAHGIQFPDKEVVSYGTITNNMSDSPKNKAFGSFKNALGIGLPLMFYDIEGKALDNFSEHECMSKYLTEWKKSRNLESIISPREGVWEITAVFVSKRKIGVKLRLVVEYDLSKNGFVTNAKYYYTWPNKPEFLAKEIIVDTIQDSEGNWWATSLRKIDKLAQSETILFQYKDVKLLQSVSSDMFQIDFPNGTMVSDMLNKMEYKVGDLVDHDKAIENFIRKHNLNNNFPSKTWYWGNMVRYILMILGIILIMAGIIVHFMKRGKQK